jgi:uncharacterized caspase-like protein
MWRAASRRGFSAGLAASKTVSGAVTRTGPGLESTFEILKEMFADLRLGSGAMVISSASGLEFALESEQWKNGVFTYATLEGMRGAADRDKDGALYASELRDYVVGRVHKLTGGRQRPTARAESFEFDFPAH